MKSNSVRITGAGLAGETGVYVGEHGQWALVYPDTDKGREAAVRDDGCLLLAHDEFVIED